MKHLHITFAINPTVCDPIEGIKEFQALMPALVAIIGADFGDAPAALWLATRDLVIIQEHLKL